MPENRAAIWESVRRALGRLVSTTHVRAVPAAWLPPVTTAQSLAGPECPPGGREQDWTPLSCVLRYAAPQAQPGGGGMDVSGVAVAVSADAALYRGLPAVHACPPLTVDVLTHRQEAQDLCAAAVGVRSEPMTVAGGTGRTAPVRLETAHISRLPTTPPGIAARPPGGWGRLSRSQKRSEDGLVPAARIQSRVSMGLRAPMTRSRRPAPAGVRFAEAFGAERQELARASQVDPADVALLGVYPQVPVAAVARLSLEEDGTELFLWLKPEALVAAAQGKAPRLATLIVGRQRSTGRMIQAIG